MTEQNNRKEKLEKRIKSFLKKIVLSTALLGTNAFPGNGQVTEEETRHPDEPNTELQINENSAHTSDDQDTLVLFNLDQEVAKRADWIVDNFLKSARKHLNALLHTQKSDKIAYVKREFFDVVSPIRHLSGKTPYCITALNRCLIDANAYGDLSAVLPSPDNKECYSANECNSFASFIKNKGFADCVDDDKKQIDYDKLEPGDIILTIRNRKGNRHARQYLGKVDGKHLCLNFNKDGIRELKQSHAIVIHVRQIVKKAIMQDLAREHLIPQEVSGVEFMTIDQIQKIQEELGRGREYDIYLTAERLRSAEKTTGKSPKQTSSALPASTITKPQPNNHLHEQDSINLAALYNQYKGRI